MVPSTTRRHLLTATATLIGSLGIGRVIATDAQTDDANDWPMLQHDPAGRSYAPTARPPRDDVAVRWKQSFDAERGFATKLPPVVSNGRVYAIGRELIVLDAEAGTVHYHVEQSANTAPAIAPARAYTSPTLTLVDGRGVTGLHASGGLELLGSRIAGTRWEISAGGDDLSLGGFTPEPVSPVVANETVLAARSGQIVAVDASSGDIQWEIPGGSSRPAVHEGTVYVAEYPRGVRGYDLVTGDQTFEPSANGITPLGVTAGPDQLVVATDEGLAGLTYDGTVRWRFEPEDLSRDRGAVALGDGVAYGGFRGEADSMLVAVDVTDGTEQWRSPVSPESTPRFAPPAVADGIVCVPLEDGGIAGIDAGDGHVRWQFDTGEPGFPWSPAALVGETVYVVGNGHIYALEEA
jgi:outer membrane protein assembly factor BamB